MRRRRGGSAAIAVAAALVLLAGACSKKASHDPIGTLRSTTQTTLVARANGYVALGDSYGAGGGAPPYDVSAPCAVSSKGYPYVLAAADDQVHLVGVRACGGARTTQMLEAWPERGQPAQIPATPDGSIGLVTFTIGGNDTTLPEGVVACATLDCSSLGRGDTAKAELAALTDALITKVYPALRAAYPKARLVQVGYPFVTSTRLGQTCPWLAANEEAVPNAVVALVNAAAATAARRSGQVEYLDVSTVFHGHEMCTADPWANDLSAGINALHPNAAGYLALGRAIAADLKH